MKSHGSSQWAQLLSSSALQGDGGAQAGRGPQPPHRAAGAEVGPNSHLPGPGAPAPRLRLLLGGATSGFTPVLPGTILQLLAVPVLFSLAFLFFEFWI